MAAMAPPAASTATADRRIVHQILRHLSDMKYRDRRQRGSDEPVEFLEFRPTLVPSILVNKLWADEGTSILWRRYPHLPALYDMPVDRRQWYADKVERLFVPSPTDNGVGLAYLQGLDWPSLETLELDIDWRKHNKHIGSMLHAGLQHLKLLGPQSSDLGDVTHTVLSALFKQCPSLRSVHIGPDAIDPRDPVRSQELMDLLDSASTVTDICIMNAAVLDKDRIFERLSQRSGLEALQIDLDPGLQLLPCFTGPSALPSPFLTLRRLQVMCYPEIAIALPSHLQLIEDLHIDVARVPTHVRQDNDTTTLNDIIDELAQCKQLQSLHINIGQLALDFPSAISCPSLSGLTLTRLAAGCSKLQNLNLLTTAPGAIDGSAISILQFEEFCQGLPQLASLSLKLHPQTAIELESTALQSLGRNCPLLETLRLRISLHLPDLPMHIEPLPLHPIDALSQNPMDTERAPQTPSITINDDQKNASLQVGHVTGSKTPSVPLFPNLRHFALARPQSILSIAGNSYAASSTSRTGSFVDPLVEQSLVESWAQPLAAHLPRLEVLEAWGDWTGHDSETLNYFLPLEEVLATTWEFLSGVEQDLWDEEDVGEVDSGSEWKENRTDRFSMTSVDWDLASLVNEFRAEEDFDSRHFLDTYDEEPEDMVTPVRIPNEEDAYFGNPSAKITPASDAAIVTLGPEAVTCSV
ncbi:hypothetical protein ACJQWK_10069 [Exserohilum turcicum]|uniref:Uncharacterized protein n=1 Tax=Exserohilum turcicum (strain 28A) TaxID=671987 RepID=R0I608_EXST2|nr:uncharacterized protein SETTUDRAFT_166435 [Exserohilum turcica Et28A]EOA81050.1 hypothetical protein SETTUDRAFT_166435 [Exserohilum turcica Et28A]